MSKLNNAKEIEFSKELQAHITPIDGLVWYDLPVHGDARGWFKENWQHEKMAALGLPDFGPVQNNISFNAQRGVTRGIHAEPWDKYISIANGKIFGAWVDLREGESFGTVFTAEIDPTKAIYVPRGVGNAFQALEDNTIYTYLVNDHWSAEAPYTFLNLADDTVNIPWPIELSKAELSDKDRRHPSLADVVPMKPKKTLITGAQTKIGRALVELFPEAETTTRDDLDITSDDLATLRPWRQYDTIINASEYSEVDEAETAAGEERAWSVNAAAVANLASVATTYGLTLVHYSSDYVFNGKNKDHTENEVFTPLNAFGRSKAAGDLAASVAAKHFIIRTGWVIGDGKNFVDTIHGYAEQELKPRVVGDQVGRLTFACDLARATKFLLESGAPYGTYNVTNSGDPASWADIAKEVYRLSNRSAEEVTTISSDEYASSRDVTAHRPPNSTYNLEKLANAGYIPRDWRVALKEYLKKGRK